MTHKHFTPDEAVTMREQAEKAAEEYLMCQGEFHPDFHAVADHFLCEAAVQAALAKQGEVVAYCALTPSGKIAYFDGKPMVMAGPVGNEHHPHPLYTTPQPAEKQGEASRPDLLEKLTYHALECDDMTLDEVLEVLANGWKKVHGRTERQFLLQLVRLMASAPSAPQPAAQDKLREALQFYADGLHFTMHDKDAWDTVSGEPPNFWCDEAGTATVEDGSVAGLALRGHLLRDEEEQQELDAVIACLGDDAAKLRETNPEDEMADNMDNAAHLLQVAYGIKEPGA